MRKPSPKSNQATLTEEQQERLFEACVPMGYYRAALWAEKEFGLQTSTASLSRWYSKRAKEMTAGRLRKMLEGADEFDAQLDRKQVDAKISNLLRTRFFEVIQSTQDIESVKSFGTLLLNFVRNEQNDERLDVMRKRLEQTEEQLRIARADSQQLAVEGLLEEAKGNEEAKKLLNQFLAALKK